MTILDVASSDFTLPSANVAGEPPEARGLRRDEVRLLVSDGFGLAHRHFYQLPDHLEPGDLVVVNDSRTRPAAVDALRLNGDRVCIHFSMPSDDGFWIVEIRPPDLAEGPVRTVAAGDELHLVGPVTVTLVEPYPDWSATRTRLWRAQVSTDDVPRLLEHHGRAIRYAYVPEEWPLHHYQTIFAERSGSAEMPSAGRPFTWKTVSDLGRAGVTLAAITLHAGVSSPEAGEPPTPERYAVPPLTARRVNAAHANGHRVIAVGTTVTRALESAAHPSGIMFARRGWTNLVLGAERPAWVVDGLITGWHLPGSSHLALLSAVAGGEAVARAYDAALTHGYLWHEFGDSSLLTAPRDRGRR